MQECFSRGRNCSIGKSLLTVRSITGRGQKVRNDMKLSGLDSHGCEDRAAELPLWGERS